MHQFDVIIFGGGIAGLWALNQLQQAGYTCALLERQALGHGQTINAQGIIHSGIKYMLIGKQNQSAQTISSMTQLWDHCLSGQGKIDLSTVTCLSTVHHLWSEKKLNPLFKNFLNRQLCSPSSLLTPEQYPKIFQHHFQGSMMAIQEKVLATPSLITTLAAPQWPNLYKVDRLDLEMSSNCHIAKVNIGHHHGQTMQLTAQRYLFTVGGGYQMAEKHFPELVTTQVRPLHMVVAYHNQPMPLYGHWIRMHPTPLLTITTHPCQNGQWAWYIGGHIAEQGIDRTPAKQQQQTKQLLSRLMPWIEPPQDWYSFLINRHEGKQRNLKRPNSPTIKARGNIIMAWPTKLTLAPQLAANILQQLQGDITPQATLQPSIPSWPRPSIAQPQWDRL